MKRLYKVFLFSLMFGFLLSTRVKAEQSSFSIVSNSDTTYTANVTMANGINSFGDSRDLKAYIGKPLSDYSIVGGLYKDGLPVMAKFTWEDPKYVIISGEQYVNLICTTREKTLTLKIYLNGVEMPYRAPVSIDKRDEVPEDEDAITAAEITPPSLTATSVTLPTATAYDINIVDNTVGNKYTWESSDTSIATVNAKNGLVRAVKPGKVTITCTATLPNGKIHTLTSLVTVGEDDNAPVLTDSALDLSIGDTYQINIENRIAKSNYKYASSDWSKIRVNSATGKIRAVGEGEAFVTCTITTPDQQVIVLKCDVTITK